MTDKIGDLKERDDRNAANIAEIVSVSISVVLVLALFGYVGYQAAVSPSGPEFEVDLVKVEERGEDLAVHVRLTNHGNVGVRSVEVEVPCDDPAPALTFNNVPASGERHGVLLCPADAEDLEPKVSGWVKT